ncbi:pre-mRNA-splicing factor CWC22 homolog [Leptopilina heterotoma]|uniref:pre-mRNA-splicing factor CWC22 homolog n=1 Tax=Leptopilina heterotoma TaxID=63436 RepID=UPI001CAA01AA|nr:pre-mRNA-splicing factor CWC22 homolog [Leptopilina heterotoma]
MENIFHLKETITSALYTCENYEEWAGKFFSLIENLQPSHELCQIIINGFIESHLNRDYYYCFATWLGSTNVVFRSIFEKIFENLFESELPGEPDLHRIYEETKFFARLIYENSISWDVLSCIQLKANSSAVQEYFVTLLFLELSANFGKRTLCERLEESKSRNDFKGLFPKDNLDNTRFAIKIFELVDLHDLTHDLHAHINEYELNCRIQKLSL